jgi:chorismate mutase
LKPLNLKSKKSPLVIAGPCSAESYEQLKSVSEDLKVNPRVDLFRAGIWKPRTRPNSFEGVGQKGLQWLSEIQRELKFPVITEVASANHVEMALKAGIKHLWIGARTTVSPFAVQEIALACKGEDLAIFVKNPIHPDIDLWQGSIERFVQNGNDNIAGIHRGFSSFISSEYRNLPNWKIPIELQRRIPDLPIICDPSHIAGKQHLVPQIAQKAFDLNMAGIMVEVHPSPESALSDPQQQLTPQDFAHLLNNLKIRNAVAENAALINQLDEYRSQIDKIDEDILTALSSRLKLINEIGAYKQKNNLAVFQIERWRQILNSRTNLGDQLNMSTEFIKKLFETVHSESIRIQTEINRKQSSKD